jgi:hypothetical protein
MLRIELFDRQQFSGKIIVSPINITDHIVDLAGHAWQQIPMVRLENL